MKCLEIDIAEQAAATRYAGLRWLMFVIASAAATLISIIGIGLMGLTSNGYYLIVGGLIVEGIVAFRLRRAYSELKGLEKDHLQACTELAELRAVLHRTKVAD
jgi:hypothetical protein